MHRHTPQTRASVEKSQQSIIGATDMRQGLVGEGTEFGVRKKVGGASGGHGPAALRGWDYPIGALNASCSGLGHRAAWGDGVGFI